MKVQKPWSIVVCALIGWTGVYATSEFRTPLDFLRPAYLHYPFEQVKKSWWFDICATEEYGQKKEFQQWEVSLVSGLYGRTASKAFVSQCPMAMMPPVMTSSTASGCCDDDRGRDHLAPLAALWFGQSSFVAEQAFAGGIITSAAVLAANPILAFSTISPRFTYYEKGAWLGARGEFRVGPENKWALGFRASLPFKEIEVVQHYDFGVDAGNGIETGLTNVYKETILAVDANRANNQVDYAYRLDFLSALIRPSFTNPTPMIQFGAGAAPDVTEVGGTFVGSNTNTAGVGSQPPAYVIKSASGALPTPQQLPLASGVYAFAKQQSQVSGSLPANGAGVDGSTYYFDAASNYAAALGTSRATQATLFLVPRMYNSSNDSATGQPATLTAGANAIRNAIEELLGQFNIANADSAVSFLATNCGIDLSRYERVIGIGDLNTEFYFGYGPEDKKWYTNGVVGVLFPTAKNDSNPNRVYYQPTGNHKHVEAKIGLEAGYRCCRYFALNGDLFYSHAFKKEETRAAPFVGATVTNIGAPVKMDISWDAFLGHIDATLFNPYNSDLVFSVGYEGYFKRKDKIQLSTSTTTDCLGTMQPLDARILERNSDTLSHKIRAEVSHRVSYFEFTLAGSHVVAGRNVMQETEAHIGTAIYF
jgi:hypothetical protein